MHTRKYGNSEHSVVVLHGGPAAWGDVAPVAQGLSDSFTAIEPWQRGSAEEPLTVARHIEDLHDLIGEIDSDSPPALVGHSWGAMLALCYAAAYPHTAEPIVLVGCGTFDLASRARMKDILRERADRQLPGDVYERVEPWPDKKEYEPLDVRAHRQTWDDMMRLQSDGTYPAAFAAIESDVLMLHGSYDPHPGPMIYASLRPFIRRLEYRELDRCGHSPWLERFARDEFFSTLKAWLLARIS